MKKFMALVLALAMVFALCACGSSSTEAAEATEAAAAEATEAAAETDASKYEVTEPITITFWHNYGDGKRATFLQEVAEKFHEENPDITVELVYIGGYAVISEQIAGALAAGEGLPALSTINVPRVRTYAASEIIEPLDAYFDAYGVETSEYYDGMIDALTYTDDQIYAVPFGISSSCCIYNKTLCDELGLPFPETWEEFKIWCHEVTEATGYPAFGFAYDFNYMNSFIINVTGIDPLGDGTVSALDDERIINFAKDVRELIADGCALYMGSTVNEAQEDQRTAFSLGELAAYTDTCTGIAGIVSAVDGAFEIGATLGVSGTDADPIGTVSGSTLITFADNDQQTKNAAVQFMLYLTNAENSATWSIETGMMSTHPASDISAMYEQYPNTEAVFDNACNIIAKNPSTAMQSCMETVVGVFGEYVKGDMAEEDFDAQWALLKEEVDGMLADAAAG